ncbi:MFS transporter [Kitasatospora cinereorecta]|uniref:MFS transporter n=1 Tax=Kitasatospora cinereorecta TaxID=285560 RepID=A0ABW0VM15_9ACTN
MTTTLAPAHRPVRRPTARPALRPWSHLPRRYAVALGVDALGAGLLRPFLLLYGVSVLHLTAGRTGLALTVGLFAGLAAVPLTGRWIDRGARSSAAALALLLRALGVVVLMAADGPVGFTAAVVVLGVGNQSWPTAHAAVVTAVTEGRARDAALAAGRSLRNAGLGLGALIATAVLAGGAGALRTLAAVTGVAFLAAAALTFSLRLSGTRRRAAGRPAATPDAPAAPVAAVRLGVLGIANLPYAFCFDVLEVALPALLVTRLHASAAWASGIFVGNTVLVIAAQVAVVVRLGRRARRSALAGAGLLLAASYLGFWAAGSLGGTAGAIGLVAVAVPYTLGEILYTGSGTALVVASAPPERLGRALARWELSTGLGKALAPAALTALLGVGPGALWGALAAATALGAAAVRRWGPAI